MSKQGTLKTIWRADKKCSVSIIQKQGLFSFAEEGECHDLYEYNGQQFNETYWAPISGGGLYDSVESAEAAARTEVAWLREQD